MDGTIKDAAETQQEYQRGEEEDTIQDLLDYGDGDELLDYGEPGGSEVDEDEQPITQEDQEGEGVQEGGAEAVQQVRWFGRSLCHTWCLYTLHHSGTVRFVAGAVQHAHLPMSAGCRLSQHNCTFFCQSASQPRALSEFKHPPMTF